MHGIGIGTWGGDLTHEEEPAKAEPRRNENIPQKGAAGAKTGARCLRWYNICPEWAGLPKELLGLSWDALYFVPFRKIGPCLLLLKVKTKIHGLHDSESSDLG